MDYNRVIQILRNEYECAIRDDCDRACCAKCDLAMDKNDVLTALFFAIRSIRIHELHEIED